MVFKVGGIRVKLDFTFAAAVTLMLVFASSRIAVISFLSSLAHEAGHTACILLFGIKPEIIRLSFFGMRMECAGENILDYRRDAVFLLSGAAVNIFTAVTARIIGLTGASDTEYVTVINLIIAGFNLLPAVPLDGGRALYLLVCGRSSREKAERVIKITSYFTVAFLICFGIYLYLCRRLSFSYAAVTVYLSVQTFLCLKKSP